MGISEGLLMTTAVLMTDVEHAENYLLATAVSFVVGSIGAVILIGWRERKTNRMRIQPHRDPWVTACLIAVIAIATCGLLI